MPVLPSCEHDPLVLCDLSYSKCLQNWPEPMPPTTAVVDSSIKLFSQLLPVQDGSSALNTVNQLVSEMKSPKFEKNIGRRAAVHVNSVTAVVTALRSVMDGPHRSARATLSQPNITMPLSTSLKVSLYFYKPTVLTICRTLSRTAILSYARWEVKRLEGLPA
jgi:hypothetical protein